MHNGKRGYETDEKETLLVVTTFNTLRTIASI